VIAWLVVVHERDSGLLPPDFGLVAATYNLATFNVQLSYAQPVSAANSRVYSMKLGHEISGGTPWSQLGM